MPNIELITPEGEKNPLKLYRFQELLMNRLYDHHYNAILGFRQSGKSLISAVYANECRTRGEKTLIITIKNFANPFNNTNIVPDKLPFGHIHVVGIHKVVNMLNDNPDALNEYDSIIFDEAAYLSNAFFKKVLTHVMALPNMPRVTLFTTPSAYKGHCHSIYNAGNTFKITYIRPFVDPRWTPEKRALMKSTLGEELFNREYNLKW